MEISLLTAFIAGMMATIAGMVSLLPGGLGSYEAASIAILLLLGLSFEEAFTGTLLLRGFTLWLPLTFGILLLQKDTLTGDQEKKRALQ